ncbi:peptide/nickel transport system ATP-binding protein [Rhizobiales bacterium GAS188]|nr:peptide/nickel transport system ATP-binding protein [Rhizobiales bacterium GAS188]
MAENGRRGLLRPAQGGAPLIELSGLTVAFGEHPVLRGLNLRLGRGEALGMVGESGSGKSVTWLAALGLLPRQARVSGEARLAGENIIGASEQELSRIRGGRIGLIFQDPISSLNPVHRVGAQLVEALRLHRGLGGDAAKAEARRLFELVGIPDAQRRLDLYPHELSGGQNQRVMIAMALAGEPELLIADEPTTALDATIQAQILDLIDRLRRELGMALVLISHDLGVVAELCDRILVMYAGGIVEEAPADLLFAAPAHPYTRGLIGAVPPLTGARRRLTAIPGQVPEPWNMPSGCAFAPRCVHAAEACSVAPPPMADAGAGRRAACIRLDEIASEAVAA